MNNLLVAIDLVLRLFAQFDKVLLQYREVIKRARDEGRDITDEELLDLRAKSQDALDRWLDQGS